MDIIFDIVSVRTFWRILLFVHFLLAVALLAAVTLQAAAIMIPVRQAAGTFIQRLRPGPAASYAAAIVILYVPTFLLGAWIYIKYHSDGAIRPLVDRGFLRIQRACRDHGLGPPSGLLVFLAAASVRATC